MSKTLSGECACGEVQYELGRVPMFTHCCHCLECQRQTGSAFVINGLIETDQITVSGLEPVPVPVPTSSGRQHDVYRCPRCQTALWSDYGGRSWLRFVRIGTLHDPSSVSPDVHVFARSKRDWVGLPEDVPVFDVFYDMKELWPSEALARRQAASDAANANHTD
nr:GFA family protein [Cucumibacter marinus]